MSADTEALRFGVSAVLGQKKSPPCIAEILLMIWARTGVWEVHDSHASWTDERHGYDGEDISRCELRAYRLVQAFWIELLYDTYAEVLSYLSWDGDIGTGYIHSSFQHSI